MFAFAVFGAALGALSDFEFLEKARKAVGEHIFSEYVRNADARAEAIDIEYRKIDNALSVGEFGYLNAFGESETLGIYRYKTDTPIARKRFADQIRLFAKLRISAHFSQPKTAFESSPFSYLFFKAPPNSASPARTALRRWTAQRRLGRVQTLCARTIAALRLLERERVALTALHIAEIAVFDTPFLSVELVIAARARPYGVRTPLAVRANGGKHSRFERYFGSPTQEEMKARAADGIVLPNANIAICEVRSDWNLYSFLGFLKEIRDFLYVNARGETRNAFKTFLSQFSIYYRRIRLGDKTQLNWKSLICLSKSLPNEPQKPIFNYPKSRSLPSPSDRRSERRERSPRRERRVRDDYFEFDDFDSDSPIEQKRNCAIS